MCARVLFLALYSISSCLWMKIVDSGRTSVVTFIWLCFYWKHVGFYFRAMSHFPGAALTRITRTSCGLHKSQILCANITKPILVITQKLQALFAVLCPAFEVECVFLLNYIRGVVTDRIECLWLQIRRCLTSRLAPPSCFLIVSNQAMHINTHTCMFCVSWLYKRTCNSL